MPAQGGRGGGNELESGVRGVVRDGDGGPDQVGDASHSVDRPSVPAILKASLLCT